MGVQLCLEESHMSQLWWHISGYYGVLQSIGSGCSRIWQVGKVTSISPESFHRDWMHWINCINVTMLLHSLQGRERWCSYKYFSPWCINPSTPPCEAFLKECQACCVLIIANSYLLLWCECSICASSECNYVVCVCVHVCVCVCVWMVYCECCVCVVVVSNLQYSCSQL